ncbi:terminase small subunit [Agromyces indicus]|uniref:terminase small subunit n=1 Tax=Agromyces indicus TaxID=758919 RepID=UPI003CD0A4B5
MGRSAKNDAVRLTRRREQKREYQRRYRERKRQEKREAVRAAHAAAEAPGEMSRVVDAAVGAMKWLQPSDGALIAQARSLACTIDGLESAGTSEARAKALRCMGCSGRCWSSLVGRRGCGCSTSSDRRACHAPRRPRPLRLPRTSPASAGHRNAASGNLAQPDPHNVRARPYYVDSWGTRVARMPSAFASRASASVAGACLLTR